MDQCPGEGRHDDQGKRVQMAGICIDVTTRKKIEEALKNIDRLDIISNTASQLFSVQILRKSSIPFVRG